MEVVEVEGRDSAPTASAGVILAKSLSPDFFLSQMWLKVMNSERFYVELYVHYV